MSITALIDYGSGNLRSAQKALQRAAETLRQPCEILVTADPDRVAGADRIVLPGVGAFAACMNALAARPGLIDAMTLAVKGRGAPFLGVCVGMQLLASRGLEFGETPGLGWIPGEVRRLEPSAPGAKVPHVGWNEVRADRTSRLFSGEVAYYFTHSYAFWPTRAADAVASVDHGGRFAAAVELGTIAGVQFHPEKSQAEGVAMIRRFLTWRP
jgi:glutamine amidotransferase